MDPVVQHLQEAMDQLDRIAGDVVSMHGGEPFPGFTAHIEDFKNELRESLTQIQQGSARADEAEKLALAPQGAAIPHAVPGVAVAGAATSATKPAEAAPVAKSHAASGVPKLPPIEAIPDMTLDDFEAAYTPTEKQIQELIQNLIRGSE